MVQDGAWAGFFELQEWCKCNVLPSVRFGRAQMRGAKPGTFVIEFAHALNDPAVYKLASNDVAWTDIAPDFISSGQYSYYFNLTEREASPISSLHIAQVRLSHLVRKAVTYRTTSGIQTPWEKTHFDEIVALLKTKWGSVISSSVTNSIKKHVVLWGPRSKTNDFHHACLTNHTSVDTVMNANVGRGSLRWFFEFPPSPNGPANGRVWEADLSKKYIIPYCWKSTRGTTLAVSLSSSTLG